MGACGRHLCIHSTVSPCKLCQVISAKHLSLLLVAVCRIQDDVSSRRMAQLREAGSNLFGPALCDCMHKEFRLHGA
jgi:hypothetical protein